MFHRSCEGKASPSIIAFHIRPVLQALTTVDRSPRCSAPQDRPHWVLQDATRAICDLDEVKSACIDRARVPSSLNFLTLRHRSLSFLFGSSHHADLFARFFALVLRYVQSFHPIEASDSNHSCPSTIRKLDSVLHCVQWTCVSHLL